MTTEKQNIYSVTIKIDTVTIKIDTVQYKASVIFDSEL